MTDTHRKILYVGGCADEVTEAVLHAAFLPFGNLETVQIPLDHKTQKNRGFGFVQYEERDDAAAALARLRVDRLVQEPLVAGTRGVHGHEVVLPLGGR